MKRSRILRKGRYIKTSRNFSERLEGVKGADRATFPEVYTRLSKKEYESRRDLFDEGSWGAKHLSEYSYDEWTEWGSLGGRPRIWVNEAQRKKFERINKKIEEGRPLRPEDREFLKSIDRSSLLENI